MSDLRIITNNVPRDVIDAYELGPDDRAEFDYIDWAAVERGEESREFVRYKGQLYDLGDTEGLFPPDRRWLYVSDSFFSGVLFRFPIEGDTLDTEHVIVGRYLS